MPKKDSTVVNDLLFFLSTAEEILSVFLTSPQEWKRRMLGKSYGTYRSTVYNSRKRGLIEVVNKKGVKFLKLTNKGQLEVLLAKAKMPQEKKWDGKWRIVIFDIPERAKERRDLLRSLLKKNNFYKLQDSVYICPHSLNREAITYLQKTGLIEFIRILKVQEIDNDKDLKKKFNL